ncbi:hypothetical protein ACFPWT_16955 [Streptomyces formicae]
MGKIPPVHYQQKMIQGHDSLGDGVGDADGGDDGCPGGPVVAGGRGGLPDGPGAGEEASPPGLLGGADDPVGPAAAEDEAAAVGDPLPCPVPVALGRGDADDVAGASLTSLGPGAGSSLPTGSGIWSTAMSSSSRTSCDVPSSSTASRASEPRLSAPATSARPTVPISTLRPRLRRLRAPEVRRARRPGAAARRRPASDRSSSYAPPSSTTTSAVGSVGLRCRNSSAGVPHPAHARAPLRCRRHW